MNCAGHNHGTGYFKRSEPEPAPRYRIKSTPHGDGGWVHRIVYVKPQSYKDPKRLETERTGHGPFRDHAEAKAILAKLNA